ncbi:hypothetical protein [Lysobacter sp. M15]|uniref:hypothetical protein n=1 Tax=Lysobacter sp. M15 TaxID=2916837 RepID=UPI001F574A41|nr:hypothetical protein [Lysobacter sp. M15]
MTRPSHLLAATVLGIAAFATTLPTAAQEAPNSIVSLYRVAPGKHLEFLKWMAARDAVDREIGVAATQWYAHLSGDSWDYIAIAPDLDEATSERSDAEAKKRGLTTGARASLEFRQVMAYHTDTLVSGPYTAEQLVEQADK